MSLNFGEDYDKKINLEDNSFRTFEGIQIKLNESDSSEKNSGRPTETDSKQVLLTSKTQVDSVSNDQFNTLKEPIIETLKRDLLQISLKLKFVLVPQNASNFRQLYNCNNQIKVGDLWGPLLLCLSLSLLLFSSANDSKGVVFVQIFTIFWFGGIVVTYNAMFLGATISLFQSLCLLGYCVFPIDLAAFILRVFPDFHRVVKFIIAITCFLWSSICKIILTLASSAFLGQVIKEDKKMLVIYPVYLFFLFLTWFVLNLNGIL